MAGLGGTARRKEDQDSLKEDLPELEDWDNMTEIEAASNKVMYFESTQ